MAFIARMGLRWWMMQFVAWILTLQVASASLRELRHRRQADDAPGNVRVYVRPLIRPTSNTESGVINNPNLETDPSPQAYRPPLLPPGSSTSLTSRGPLPSLHLSSGYQPPLSLLQSDQQSSSSDPPRESPAGQRLVYVGGQSELSQSPPSPSSEGHGLHSKAIGSSHHPLQAIHKVPASEIQANSNKGGVAKEKDGKNDEYVVYYYYYYDNDTNAKNLSLNFDDIPTLESYDEGKSKKEPEKSASARSVAANVNALPQSLPESPKNSVETFTPVSEKNDSEAGSSPQGRSVPTGEVGQSPLIQADRSSSSADSVAQPLKPVSNVYRYGSNEVPLFPILPNFVVSQVPSEAKPPAGDDDLLTPDSSSSSSTPAAPTTSGGALSLDSFPTDVERGVDDASNDVESETNVDDEKPSGESTTTTTTTTETPTTTELPTTTTTERSRRRPGSAIGGRRRFSPSPAAPSRGRQPSRTTPGSLTSSTTTSSPETTSQRSFRGPAASNRLRPRPAIGGNRPRSSLPNSRTADDTGGAVRSTESSSSSSTTTRSRFSTTAAPRRFAASRPAGVRTQISSSTSTTPVSRLRTTSRPRTSLLTRNRPRPGFLKPRGSKDEEPEEETTTIADVLPVTEKVEPPVSSSANPEEESSSEEDEEDTEKPEAEDAEESEEAPTTTEKNRFSALFRPRNRASLGNRPRPVLGNRPTRAR